ncbi:hypothetical protein BDV27DRAFT_133854 [Aspergillus caelatus]|uniref:Uncharacterized protein n=1 Tax=Aspergillus caelatus TaxID=61420 RepID=A0A5N6ZX87_9EURO|nr:uncharacterized protein BDV27DRAFT_133854 [Aspergillus caelatus]KAE8360880.1 hypothetical protein BDV27DRAFT_133854 [Aspergillus caelatus]
MNLLVRPLVEGFCEMKSGKTRSLDPGGTDIQMAIDFAKLSPRPQPISREELAVQIVMLTMRGFDAGKQLQTCLNFHGLLSRNSQMMKMWIEL